MPLAPDPDREAPMGRCARCSLMMPVAQTRSGLWQTIDHFGCVGSLVPASQVVPDPTVPPAPEWEIASLRDAARVINILHRRTVRDAASLGALESRLARLELPWHRRLWRKLRGR